MKRFGLDSARILEMDAEQMEFDDNSFDFIWTWGVIHHSANTKRIFEEMARVIRPGGRATVMVYHRGWWNYYFVGTVFLGILCGDLFRTGNLHKTMQNRTDGALARYYSLAEWYKEASLYFRVGSTQVYGPKSDLLPIPGGSFKTALMGASPSFLCRFLTNRCRMG
jgi:SAM-dependent methyltransferase